MVNLIGKVNSCYQDPRCWEIEFWWDESIALCIPISQLVVNLIRKVNNSYHLPISYTKNNHNTQLNQEPNKHMIPGTSSKFLVEEEAIL